ncbi:hypothetical protein ACH5RR_003402 [Cinchona calisaya]|uniref:Uncharacterized protein n=1 Tax=Cinchona calisaya TaxID=153742 RepID=A0ABD3AUR0_9GENT
MTNTSQTMSIGKFYQDEGMENSSMTTTTKESSTKIEACQTLFRNHNDIKKHEVEELQNYMKLGARLTGDPRQELKEDWYRTDPHCGKVIHVLR